VTHEEHGPTRAGGGGVQSDIDRGQDSLTVEQATTTRPPSRWFVDIRRDRHGANICRNPGVDAWGENLEVR
jgi:hypothetical protein